jgi:hypothetical protein
MLGLRKYFTVDSQRLRANQVDFAANPFGCPARYAVAENACLSAFSPGVQESSQTAA